MAYTTASSTNYVQAAYDRLAYFGLRPELYYDALADVTPTDQAMPGSTVTFTITADLPIASSTLSETTDVTPVALSSSQVSVTLAEYGNVVNSTALFRGTAFVNVDPMIANVVGYNAGVSIDEVVKAIVQAGTNVAYSTGSGSAVAARTALLPTNTIRALDFRNAATQLKRQNVPTFGGSYVAMIHPDVVLDLRNETGSGAWRTPHEYQSNTEIFNGELGSFERFRYIENSRAPIFAGGGTSWTKSYSLSGATATVASGTNDSNIQVGMAVTGTGVPANTYVSAIASTTTLTLSNSCTTESAENLTFAVDAYGTLCMGRQSLAKAWSFTDGNAPQPKIVPGPVVDALRRFVPLGWYWLGGYSIFRQASLLRIESASSFSPGYSAGTTSEPSIDA